MSDVKKAPSSRETIPPAATATHETATKTEGLAQQSAEEVREVSAAVVDAVSRTADAANEISQRVAEQGREAMMVGVRAAAGVNGRIVEIGYDNGHRWLASAAQAMNIYRGASESAAEQMQALFASYLTIGRGIQQFQHAWLHLLDHAVEQVGHRPHDLLQCKTAAEVAAVQRDMYLDVVNQTCDASGTLLQLAARAAQDAVRPLQGKMRETVRS